MGRYDYLVPSKSSDTATAPTSNRYASLIPASAAPKPSPTSSTPSYAPSLYDQVSPPAEKSPQLPSYVPFADAINFLVPLAKTEIKGAIEGFNETPSAPKTTDFVAGIGGGMGKAAGDAFQSGVDALSAQVPKGNAIERGAFIGDNVVKTINATFGVALSALQGYATVPIVGNVIDGVNKVFGAISKGASAGAELEVNKLPVSQETKNAILPFAKDSAALAAQMAAGKIAGDFTKASFLKLTDNSKAILTQLQNDPAIQSAIQSQKSEVPQTPPSIDQLTKAIQDKAPNLQYSRVRDIAERAQGVPLLQQPDFIKGELAKINPNSVPAYPDFNNQRATAAETTPGLANTEATSPLQTEENQPTTQYEPYIPDNQLPVIQMGAKAKSDIPTVSSETAPNVAQEALPADTRFKALSPKDQTIVRTMQRSLFGKGMDWNSAGETALARFEGQKGGSSAPLTMEPINEPSVIPEKTNISPTIKNESPKPVKSPIQPETTKSSKVVPEAPKPIERPVIDGERATKAANDINEKLVQQGIEHLTPEQMSKYTTGSYKDSEAQSEILRKTNPEALLEMAKTGKDIPPGVHPQILYNIAEALAEERFKETKDPTLQIELARSPLGRELSEAGGTLGSHGFNDNPNSAVKIIRDISETRTKATEKRSGKTASKAKSDTVKEIKNEIQKNASKRPTWEEFTKEIMCNY